MKEKTILRISLAISIIGLVTLFFLSKRIAADQVMLNKLDEMVDESVIVSGVVVDVSVSNKTTFIRIEKNEIANVVVFEKMPLLEIGDFIQVRGKVSEYDNETEIIAEEIRVV